MPDHLMQMPPRRFVASPLRRSASAFTLAELLVVIGIIGLLVAILLPVVNRVKKQGWRADSMNQINVLRSAIEQYQLSFNAYPGPFSNQQIQNNTATAANITGGTGGSATMSENLVLGLLGGLENVAGAIRFTIGSGGAFGKGPASLNPRNPKIYNAFIDGGLTQTSYRAEGTATTGKFRETPTGNSPANDTNVPEFLDRFPNDPIPVLYLRAQPGIRGFDQYAVAQALPYTRPGSAQIGPLPQVDGTQLEHGLAVQGSVNAALRPFPLNKSNPKGNDLIPYLQNRQVPATGTSDYVPRGKDSFVLISAGMDRIYGTNDDITSFGNIID